MALTTIPSELSSVSGISDSSSSTAITIDSSQNVTFAGNITTGSNTISGVLSSVTGSIGSAATATTQAASDNSTKLATTAYVTTALANLVDSAPGTLNTLNELAAALGDDANFSTTVTNSIAAKAALAGATFTGTISQETAKEAFDAAACIGCGACVASCKNSSASLFVSAKIAQLSLLPQGHPERQKRVISMVDQMDAEGFGHCSNTGACESECPKEISIKNIAKMNQEYIKATLLD